MDWPIAATILGTLGTICVALFQIMPRRSAISDREFQALQTRVDIGFDVIQGELREIKQDISHLRENQ